MYVCMSVCMYVCACVYMCLYVCVCMYVNLLRIDCLIAVLRKVHVFWDVTQCRLVISYRRFLRVLNPRLGLLHLENEITTLPRNIEK